MNNSSRIYFDNAATTPIDKEVAQIMAQTIENCYGNPSSIHAHGREARALIETCRKSVAKLLNTSPASIFFTSGGTEADNTAIRSSIVSLELTHAITSPTEHHAVLHTLKELEKKGKIKLSLVEVDEKGNINLEHLQSLLHEHPRSLVSLMQANNEIGTLSPIEIIAEICSQHQAIFHCDTVQTMGHYRHDLTKLKVDFLACAAHKFHGPKGVGFLYMNPDIRVQPFIYGGAQERNMRGGTENIYGIVGLTKALEIAYEHLEEHQTYIQGIKQYMMQELVAHIPNVSFNGETTPEHSLYTVLNVSFPESEKSEMLLLNLDIAGISASGGSACSSGSNAGSHVLKALKANPNRTNIRFSFSKYNTREDVDKTIEVLKKLQ